MNTKHYMLMAVAVGLNAHALPARTDAQSVPTLEPQLTRLYGSDSLNFGRDFGGALSPDGRWLVYANFENGDRLNLWLADIESGKAERLTDGPYYDGSPKWFPSGDRIAFRSSRFATSDQDAAFIVALAIDTTNGRPLGPPRQITLEQVDNWGFDVSPDGRSIVYSSPSGDRSLPSFGREAGGMTLTVVPATGGAARSLAVRERFVNPTWSADGDNVYFAAPEGGGDSAITSVFVVPAGGGQVRRVTSWPGRDRPQIAPGAQYLGRRPDDGWGELLTIHGEPLGRFKLPEKMGLVGFSGSGLDLLGAIQETVAPLRVQPVMGGPARQLTHAHAYEVPLGWAAHGTEILFETHLNGEDVFMLAPIDGGAMRQVSLPSGVDEYPIVSRDGRHVAYVKADEQDQSAVLTIFNLGTGERREISRSIWEGSRSRGSVQQPDEFFFVEQNGDRLELKSVAPEGSPRLLWSFRVDQFPNGLAPHGNRVAFTREAGDSTVLYVARRGGTAPRRVLAKEGRIANGQMWYPEWSPTGRLLVLPYAPAGATRTDVMIVEFDPSGATVGDARVITLDSGPKWWALTQWLPDESGFLVLGMGADALMDTNIWLISLDPDVPPVALTADEARSVWNVRLSPDGKHVAYSSETPLGGSIWKVGLKGLPQRQ